ncbi:hypothetical protein FE783_10990 [Paenibacillus mesophilus]|uniref:hypothetical protein n=1 Tax=Paenibacillus mesophilus TaxID=2582849 RepID=UPI00110D70B8|nr:hypothetical protein [Paenibacillus mesophilus]TMV50082.1 hypothetical protein FE783_10990 [Paenibacillus mesophilus]
MKKANLERLRFSGFHRSHIGAIRSCLDYYNISCSAAWVYGMTGSAFLSIIDEKCSAPNIGEPEEAMFQLARHLGVEINGFHTFAEDRQSFSRLQAEAWDAARSALDQGQPVFAKELDLGNETSVVYGYDDEGYYTHSWHGGHGHEGYDEVIPWTQLGRNYCPCRACKERLRSGEWPSESVYIGNLDEGGFISLHWAAPAAQSDDRTALKAALQLAIDRNRPATFNWGGRKFYSGLLVFDKWIEAVRSNKIQGFYMGYYADLFHEGRRYAHLFLQEASGRFGGDLGEQLSHTADHYRLIREAFQKLNELFPWDQPRSPIEDPDRRSEAVQLLTGIRSLEAEAYRKLEKLEAALRAGSPSKLPT